MHGDRRPRSSESAASQRREGTTNNDSTGLQPGACPGSACNCGGWRFKPDKAYDLPPSGYPGRLRPCQRRGARELDGSRAHVAPRVTGMAWRCRIAINSAPSRKANRARFARASKNVRRDTVGRPVTTTLRSWREPSTSAFFFPVIALMSLPMVNLCAMRGLKRTETQPAFSGQPAEGHFPKNVERRHTLRPLNTDRTLRISQGSTFHAARKAAPGEPVCCPLRDPIGEKSSRGREDF